MQTYPRAPGHMWPGHMHGAGCLSAWTMHTGSSISVWRVFLGLGFALTPVIPAVVRDACVWVRVVTLTQGSWLGPVACVLRYGCGFRPAYPG